MSAVNKRQKTVVIGAGPVGALAAIYAAQRGDDVEVYELRSDLRDPSTTPLNFTKSINLSLSERGINAMRHSGRADLVTKVKKEVLPMRARMIHGKKINGELYEQSQEYDIHGRTNFAVDRGDLNKVLLDELELMDNVKIIFNHKLTGASFTSHKAWFEVSAGKTTPAQARDQEIEVDFDFLIGADGAHSAARFHLMKYTRMDYQQEYIDTLWCEFHIRAQNQTGDDSRFAISPNHLHIWPGKDFMFIAIPSFDGSFTCTLFLPSGHFDTLEQDPNTVPAFFDEHFPGVTSLIPPSDIISSFTDNPHLPLISIKCTPHHFSDSGVIVGDAAHAMVPFYGQGMNAGLEDIRVLFSILDKHVTPHAEPEERALQRSQALAEYSTLRKEDAYAINDLALQNYTEMRASVISPTYRFRKWLEETLSVYVPSLGWQTKYARVSFGNERYSEIVKKSDHQGKLLLRGFVGVMLSPVVIGGLLGWYRWSKAYGGTRGLLKWQGWFGWKTT